MVDISRIAVSGPSAPVAGEKKADSGFADTLKDLVSEVNTRMVEADRAGAALVSGGNANIHETMIAIEKANVSFRLLTKVQSKAVAAYQEIMRLQL